MNISRKMNDKQELSVTYIFRRVES